MVGGKWGTQWIEAYLRGIVGLEGIVVQFVESTSPHRPMGLAA